MQDMGVCGLCHGVFIQRMVLVQVHVWIDMGVCGLCHGVFIQRMVQVEVWILEEIESVPLNLGSSGICPNSGFKGEETERLAG